MIVQPVSLLPLLEPLAGASFAINLAYLNLERFRYRRLIREQAQRLYAELEKAEYFDIISDFKEVGLLRDLSGLKDHDNMGNDPLNPSDEPQSDRKILITERVYRFVFKHHLDMTVCKVLAVIAGLLLYFGVMHSIGRHDYAAPTFNSAPEAHFWGEVLLLTMFVPLGLVALGNWIVGHLKDKAHGAFSEMEKAAGKMAEKAKLQGDPAVPATMTHIWDDDTPF